MEASTSNIEEWVVDYREFIIATEYDAFGLTRSKRRPKTIHKS
jgi:hypothetical protein